MPFKSEAQRRYLWANEPEIARDWADTYGSKIHAADGGIMRLPFGDGEVVDDDIMVKVELLREEYPNKYHPDVVSDEEMIEMVRANQDEETIGIGERITSGIDTMRDKLGNVKDTIGEQWGNVKDTIGSGVTSLLDNTILGRIAGNVNPFNPRAFNYQPGFQESFNQYRNQGLVNPSGQITSGPMQGYNMVSGFGSNNYRNMISNRMTNQGMFGLRGPNNEIRNQNKYNELKAELQKETQRQDNQIAPASGMSYNQVVNNMVQDSSDSQRGRPGGIGGKELMARGGLASLWQR
jgi:hypothetical protein